MPEAQYRHFGCRIMDNLVYKGLRTIFLENEVIRVGVLLDKGADIFQFLYKPNDTDFLWRSPQGLIDPRHFTATIAHPSGTFLDSFHGGWQEIFPGGGPVNYRGADIGLHGEVAQLGWDCDILEDTPQQVKISLQVKCVRTPFMLERVMHLESGNPTLFIEEKLYNLSPEAQDFMWGHHPAFGAPFLKPGMRLFVPAKKFEVHNEKFASSSILEPGAEFIWPTALASGRTLDLSTISGPEAGFSELLYLKDLSSGWFAVLDPDRKAGVGMAWPADVFPYLWFWMVYGETPGYPWWSRVYCIALEPWTSMPNSLNKVIEIGNQASLKGGGSLTVSLCMTAITDKNTVNRIDLDGSVY